MLSLFLQVSVPTGYGVPSGALAAYVASGRVPNLRHAAFRHRRITFFFDAVGGSSYYIFLINTITYIIIKLWLGDNFYFISHLYNPSPLQPDRRSSSTQIHSTPTCVEATVQRWFPVANLSQVMPVRVYEYYAPGE